jgi:hypothetical protein
VSRNSTRFDRDDDEITSADVKIEKLVDFGFVRCETGVWYSADDSRIVKILPNIALISRPYILFFKRKEVNPLMKPIIVTFGLSDDEMESEQHDRS